MHYVSWIITVPLLLIGVLFAVVNRGPVEISLWPLDVRLQAPLFVIVLLSAFIGFVLGGVAHWTAASRRRQRQRREQARIVALEKEVAQLKRNQPVPGGALLPAGTTTSR